MSLAGRIPRGLDVLFEIVAPEVSFAGFSLRAAMLRRERETARLDLPETARALRLPATKVVLVLGAQRAWRTKEAYDVAVDRLRSAGRRKRDLYARIIAAADERDRLRNIRAT